MPSVASIVSVHSDIGGEEVPAQTIRHIHLLPANTRLKITLLSRPFGKGDLPLNYPTTPIKCK
jgi:hypothetical protein